MTADMSSCQRDLNMARRFVVLPGRRSGVLCEELLSAIDCFLLGPHTRIDCLCARLVKSRTKRICGAALYDAVLCYLAIAFYKVSEVGKQSPRLECVVKATCRSGDDPDKTSEDTVLGQD